MKGIFKKRVENRTGGYDMIIQYVHDISNHVVNIDLDKAHYDALLRSGFPLLGDETEVSFDIRMISSFPYQLARINVDETYPKLNPTLTPPKVIEKIKKQKYSVYVAGFSINSMEIVCDNYDISSNGYWYFYDHTDDGREYVSMLPVNRTIIRKIETIEIDKKN
jgi:hypothetical protein